ncbi:B12-binding domain-containing radical SAM protein [Clostridium thermarum]|uniref:B12-binding domain-containing radical SAM protein n=1 Tax=Clostridium thermarum TaxID=1716543 RepID=UPI0013D48735|nr:radical SAM protein [Clostridium thermarum]
MRPLSQNILLINLPVEDNPEIDIVKEFGYNPSFALLTLGTMLDLNGYNPILMDFCYEKITASELINLIEQRKPILIGISVFTVNMHMALKIAKFIKNKFVDIPIVMGGPHATLMPDDLICSQYVDFVVRKEGEATLLELVEAITSDEERISYDEIPGLLFKREGSIIKNKLRPLITDLDLMPLLKRELMDITKYTYIINIITSRGCPGNCVYCAARTLSGNAYRSRDVEGVFLEIVLMKGFIKDRLKNIYIIDDTFTAIPQRVRKFVELINECNLNIPWRCQSRVDVMTEELLKILSSGGCSEVLYGIESGSQEVLDKIRKNIDLEHAKTIVKATYDNKMMPILSFIIGHYCDTKETMELTYEFIKEASELYKADIHLNFNTPIPGTWQYVHREELGMRIITDKYQLFNGKVPFVETDNFTVNDQREIYFKAFKYCWRNAIILDMKRRII